MSFFDYNKIKLENDKLKKQIFYLEEELELLEKENISLKREFELLEEENDSIKREFEILKEDNKMLSYVLNRIKHRKSIKDSVDVDVRKGSKRNESVYIKPPTTFLKSTSYINKDSILTELNYNSVVIIGTLKKIGIEANIVDIHYGAMITQYELRLATGSKISSITRIVDNLKINLATEKVRIEAPIPGKFTIGIEVINKVKTPIRMKDSIESVEFNNSKSSLTLVLGRDIENNLIIADLDKLQHLLIVGSIGSGKSVCINSMIISLIYKSTPDDVKFIIIDIKAVEFSIYNGIPHLLVPVITDPRKAAGALSWAVNCTLERYELFEKNNVYDIKEYNALVEKTNEKIGEEKLQKLEQIVIIIDEFSNLMANAHDSIESVICRLAQIGNRAGIHLILATQKIFADIITSAIRVNIPSHIAFTVASRTESKMAVGTYGAENLMGVGDMLYAPIGSSRPKRVQGCFVNDEEVQRIVDFVKNNRVCEYDENVAQEIERNSISENYNTKAADSEESEQDPMMGEAIECVVEAGQASTTLLQRRLRLGYARAAQLIDEMEAMGIVGSHEGSRPRKVLITYEQWIAIKQRFEDI